MVDESRSRAIGAGDRETAAGVLCGGVQVRGADEGDDEGLDGVEELVCVG